MPINATTNRPYVGLNVLMLWAEREEKQYPEAAWLTYKQCQEVGGQVRKGESSTGIIYVNRTIKDAGTEDERLVPFMRQFNVFNVAQCDNLPDHCVVAAPASPERIIPQAEALAAATLADIRTGGAHAFYRPSEDAVHIPPQPAFFDQINYYRTLFHELGHWTGHSSRLARDLTGSFGSKAYANEELVAEITAAFVCAALSIQPTVRHADYLGNWLSVLRADNRAIFRAASKASKAADFLLAFRKSEPALLPDGEDAR